jgi:hypothetical protein
VENYVYPRNGVTLGGLIFGFLPIAISVYSYKNCLNRKALLCIQSFSLCAALNHAIFLGIILTNYAWVAMTSMGFALIGPFIVCALAVFMYFLFSSALRLRKIMADTVDTTNDHAGSICVIICLFFLLSPIAAVRSTGIIKNITKFFPGRTVIYFKDCVTLNSDVTSVLQVSPDSKLIAAGCAYDLTVLDAKNLQQVFIDRDISARVTRFSPSGKYLVALGEGISGDKSNIILYETDGFRRVKEIVLYSDPNPRRKISVVDASFKPDEKSLLFMYFEYWDSKFFSSEEWKELKKKEGVGADDELLKWVPIVREVEISSGRIIREERIEGIRENDQGILRAYRFSPDASTLAGMHSVPVAKAYTGRRHISLYDTTTWEERLYRQDDPKYVVRVIYMDNLKMGKVYFLYENTHFNTVPKVGMCSLK